MSLYDRTGELSCLLRLLKESRQGQERIAVITGATGVGKTEVARAISREANDSGFIYCEATASRAERTLQFSAISQFFLSPELPADIRRQAARLLEVGAITTAVSSFEADDASTSGSPTYIAHALSTLLLEVVERTGCPLLITVDDAHHADPASLQCLSSIIGRLRRECVMVVICATIGSQPFNPAFLASLPPEPYCRHVELGTLTEPGVKALLAEHFSRDTAEQLAAECHDISGGNPVLIRGLIEDCCRKIREPGPWKLTIGTDTTRALLGILHRSDFPMLSLARCLAILGEPAHPVLAGRLAGLDCESALRTLTALRRTGSLDSICSRHPELRTALLDGLTPEERAALHAQAASLLKVEGASALVIADHLACAESTGADWEVPLLTDAAEQALFAGGVSDALRYLRLAHQLPATKAQRATILALLARAEWRINPDLTMRHGTDVIAGIQSGEVDGVRRAALGEPPDVVRPCRRGT